MNQVHAKIKDQQCPFCSKAFHQRNKLHRHLLTHSDVKPFKCKYVEVFMVSNSEFIYCFHLCFRHCNYSNNRKYRVITHCQKSHNVRGTDDDIEAMEGAERPTDFVTQIFGLYVTEEQEGEQVEQVVEQVQQVETESHE